MFRTGWDEMRKYILLESYYIKYLFMKIASLGGLRWLLNWAEKTLRLTSTEWSYPLNRPKFVVGSQIAGKRRKKWRQQLLICHSVNCQELLYISHRKKPFISTNQFCLILLIQETEFFKSGWIVLSKYGAYYLGEIDWTLYSHSNNPQITYVCMPGGKKC